MSLSAIRTNSATDPACIFLHDVTSVDFYCGLAGSDFVGDLLIEHSADYESHNLPLSRGQCPIALLQIVEM